MSWRGWLVLGAVVMVASASHAAWATGSPGSGRPSPSVRLILPRHALRAGQTVQAKIVKPASRELLISACPLLQLREAHGWKTITRTHGVHVGCPLTTSVPFDANEHYWGVVLYDDLQPGEYRITMAYKVIPKHAQRASLKHNYHLMRAKLKILRFRPGPAPRLPERQIKRIAVKAAGGHATLIQHAEGTRFEANHLAGGDLIYDWTWAYLIAIKGHFKVTPGGGGYPYATDHRAPGRGSGAEKYSVITIVIDAKTGQVEDFGASNEYPDLAKLGPVTTDYRR